MIDNSLKSFASYHPDMTLQEYVKYITDIEQKNTTEAQQREADNKQWIIDNLVGKNVLFRINGGYRIIKLSLTSRGEISSEHLYRWSAIDHMLSDLKSEMFNFVTKESKKDTFNLKWIKTPFNNGSETYSVYTVDDEKMNEIIKAFEEFEAFYKMMLNFEVFAEKVY